MYWRTAEDTNDGDATAASDGRALLKGGREAYLARTAGAIRSPESGREKRWEKGSGASRALSRRRVTDPQSSSRVRGCNVGIQGSPDQFLQ